MRCPMCNGTGRTGETNLAQLVLSTCGAKGQTQKEAAQEMGVAQSTITRIVHGRGGDAATLWAVAKWSGYEPGEVLMLAAADLAKRTEAEKRGLPQVMAMAGEHHA